MLLLIKKALKKPFHIVLFRIKQEITLYIFNTFKLWKVLEKKASNYSKKNNSQKKIQNQKKTIQKKYSKYSFLEGQLFFIKFDHEIICNIIYHFFREFSSFIYSFECFFSIHLNLSSLLRSIE